VGTKEKDMFSQIIEFDYPIINGLIIHNLIILIIHEYRGFLSKKPLIFLYKQGHFSSEKSINLYKQTGRGVSLNLNPVPLLPPP